ncbi:MAG: putative membrane protein YqiK [Myxococcota bacterium]|jgi:uncharacterized membrane protein YqiK
MGFAEGLGLGFVAALLLAALLLAALLLAALRLRRWSPSSSALIVYNGGGEVQVSFSDRWVFPIIGRVKEIDISLKTIEITRSGSEGLICKDNVRVDASCTFTLRISPTTEEVLKVA